MYGFCRLSALQPVGEAYLFALDLELRLETRTCLAALEDAVVLLCIHVERLLLQAQIAAHLRHPVELSRHDGHAAVAEHHALRHAVPAERLRGLLLRTSRAPGARLTCSMLASSGFSGGWYTVVSYLSSSFSIYEHVSTRRALSGWQRPPPPLFSIQPARQSQTRAACCAHGTAQRVLLRHGRSRTHQSSRPAVPQVKKEGCKSL